jgi:hypothetical protein
MVLQPGTTGWGIFNRTVSPATSRDVSHPGRVTNIDCSVRVLSWPGRISAEFQALNQRRGSDRARLGRARRKSLPVVRLPLTLLPRARCFVVGWAGGGPRGWSIKVQLFARKQGRPTHRRSVLAPLLQTPTGLRAVGICRDYDAHTNASLRDRPESPTILPWRELCRIVCIGTRFGKM